MSVVVPSPQLTVMPVTVVGLETAKCTVTCSPVFAGSGIMPDMLTEGLRLLVQMFVLFSLRARVASAVPSVPPLIVNWALAPTNIPDIWSVTNPTVDTVLGLVIVMLRKLTVLIVPSSVLVVVMLIVGE